MTVLIFTWAFALQCSQFVTRLVNGQDKADSSLRVDPTATTSHSPQRYLKQQYNPVGHGREMQHEDGAREGYCSDSTPVGYLAR